MEEETNVMIPTTTTGGEEERGGCTTSSRTTSAININIHNKNYIGHHQEKDGDDYYYFITNTTKFVNINKRKISGRSKRNGGFYNKNKSSTMLLLLLLLLLFLQLQTIDVVQGIKISSKTWKSLRQNPNPVPTIEELESLETLDEEIDAVINRIISKSESPPIIQDYKPQAKWLWRQWFGTVLVDAIPTTIFNMVIAFIFCIIMQYTIHHDGYTTFAEFWKHLWTEDLSLLSPSSSSSSSGHTQVILSRLDVINKIWKTLGGLTNFLLTFFVGQAYTFWRKVHDYGRSIQGRLNDIHMLLATHCCTTTTRRGGYGQQKIPQIQYAPEAIEFLLQVQQSLRTFHLLFWATYANRYRVLLTTKGFQQLVERGLLQKQELEVLKSHINIQPTHRFVASLESAIVLCNNALRSKRIMKDATNNYALEHVLLDKFCALRGTYGSITDTIAGRMPLAYTHFVQILVDSFLFLAPIAQYVELGGSPLGVMLSVGILTIFYTGMLNLAKVFLDPLDNEDYCEGCVYLDLIVLIRESIIGSTRWMDGIVTTTTTST